MEGNSEKSPIQVTFSILIGICLILWGAELINHPGGK